jgi:hypothetical protein
VTLALSSRRLRPDHPKALFGAGAWGDPEKRDLSRLGEGTMAPDERAWNVHVRNYVRFRFGRQEFVREHWRRLPRQLSLPL